MLPIQGDEHEELTRWLVAERRLALWAPEVLGCLVHVPGHWVALSPPDGAHTEGAAALLCDSLKAQPFSLSAEEIGEFFALVATFHQRASQEEALGRP